MMKVIQCKEYGAPDVLQFTDLPKPVPRPNEVLVRIRATTVTAECPKMRAFNHPPSHRLAIALLFGYPRPRRGIWGMEFAGEIVAIGADVSRFAVGERVFGYTGVGLGAYAQYRCLPEKGILAKTPANVSDSEAAALPNGALSALAYLRDMASTAAEENVLVYGASGAVGTAAVQVARALGARVTGVCSARNTTLVKSLGAERVVDYTQQDFRREGINYDIVFDTVGRTTYRDVRSSLKPHGRYLVTVFSFVDTLRMLWMWSRNKLSGGQRMIGGASNFYWKRQDLELLCCLISQGRWTSVIDRTYPWTQVADAHRYVEEGHKRGSVVLLVE